MAATKYSYSISQDFPNQMVNLSTLTQEIVASAIVTALDHINEDETADECDIWFVDALSAGDQTILDGIVAAHQGNEPYVFQFRASSKVVGSQGKTITSPTEWEDIGGAVTNISFFVADASKAWGRFSGDVKTNGAGAKLRVIRQSDGLVCSADIPIPDTEGEWAIVSFWANQNQPANPDRFVLQGYLNGATSFEVRDYAVSLMELLT